jgi:hypothetical protein
MQYALHFSNSSNYVFPVCLTKRKSVEREHVLDYICSPMFHVHFRLLLFVMCVCGVCAAQDSRQSSHAGFGIEANAIAGKVVKHEAKFTLPIPALTTGFDVGVLWKTTGKRAWEQRRNYPAIGLAFTYINYGIDSIYGTCVGFYPHITIPLLRSKKIEWTLRLGDGIGYVTRKYSRVNPVDTTNKAIGSRINDFAMVMTDVRWNLNPHWDIQLGANITHISNGSYNKPNLGINMIGAHLGVRFFPVTSMPMHTVRTLQPLKNRMLAQVRLSTAFVSSFVPGGPRYPVYIASGYVSRRWLSKNKMFAGLDYSYHQNIYAYLRNNDIDHGHGAQNSWKSAVFAGNEFLLGRVGVVLQVGVYIKEAAIKLDPYYEKIGGHYYFVQRESGPIKELFLSAFLKTHKTVAELGEIGIGVGF